MNPEKKTQVQKYIVPSEADLTDLEGYKTGMDEAAQELNSIAEYFIDPASHPRLYKRQQEALAKYRDNSAKLRRELQKIWVERMKQDNRRR